GQDHRLFEVKTAMEMEDHRGPRLGLKTSALSEDRGVLSANGIVPGTGLTLRSFSLSPQSLHQEVVVVRGDVDRQRELGKDLVRLPLATEVWIARLAQPLRDLILGEHAFPIGDCQELCDPAQIRGVFQRIVIFVRQLPRKLRATRKRPIAGSGPKEGRALTLMQPPQEDLPVLLPYRRHSPAS